MQRKKSPEELIDSVNRKYGKLFGDDKQLVGFKQNLDGLETEDFMKFLKND